MDIAAALATVKAVSDLTASILSGVIDDKVRAKATELNSSIITLQGTIFSIQSENQELLEANKSIKQELIEISDWNNEKNRYQLTELSSGVFVYLLKEDECKSEPIHCICPNCYQQQKKSILQLKARTRVGAIYVCHNCDSTIIDVDAKRTIAEML